MRCRMLLLLAPVLSGCDPYYVYGPGAHPQPVYPSTYQPPYASPPAPYYGDAPGGYNAANCGTPDQPKPCYR